MVTKPSFLTLRIQIPQENIPVKVGAPNRATAAFYDATKSCRFQDFNKNQFSPPPCGSTVNSAPCSTPPASCK